MTQSGDDLATPLPHIMSVVGLKKSGKTMVVTALLSELRSRGHRVASIKKMEHPALSLDSEGTDTRRHADAGAEVVVALLEGETVRFERSSPKNIRDILNLFPRDTEFLVCEGMVDREAPQAIVLSLRSMDDLAETLKVRGIQACSVLAVSGVAAEGAPHRGAVGPGRIPVFNAADAIQRRALTDLIIDTLAGSAGTKKKAYPDE